MRTIAEDFFKEIEVKPASPLPQKALALKETFQEKMQPSRFSEELSDLQEEMGKTVQAMLENQEKKEAENILVVAPLNPLIHFSGEVDTTMTASASASIDALFQEMTEKMLMMHEDGKTETTFFLSEERFASSPFYGMRITIEEFSTAPKIFNISFSASAQGAAFLQQHTGALFSLFKMSDFRFSVNRIDTDLLPARHSLVKRKEFKEST